MKIAVSALSWLATTATAARFTLHIPTTPLVNPSTLPPTTHATLQSSGEPQDARLTRSNSFNFHNVSAGSYLATIYSRDHVFEPLRIDVSIEEAVEGSGEKKEVVRAWQTFVGNEWDNKGEARGEGGNGLVIEARPLAPKFFYQERGGCEYKHGFRIGSVYANTGR
jgi:non-ribosomal peptide synthetase component F